MLGHSSLGEFPLGSYSFDQTIVVGLYTNSNTFFTHSVSSTYSIVAPLHTNTNDFYPGIINQDNPVIVAPFYVNTNNFYSGNITYRINQDAIFRNGNVFFNSNIKRIIRQYSIFNNINIFYTGYIVKSPYINDNSVVSGLPYISNSGNEIPIIYRTTSDNTSSLPYKEN